MMTAVLISGLWALSAVYSASGHSLLFLVVLENLRNLAWFVFLLALLRPAKYPQILNWAIPALIAATLSIELLDELFPLTLRIGQLPFDIATVSVLGHVIQAIIGQQSSLEPTLGPALLPGVTPPPPLVTTPAPDLAAAPVPATEIPASALPDQPQPAAANPAPGPM